jgi:hypothetical protein
MFMSVGNAGLKIKGMSGCLCYTESSASQNLGHVMLPQAVGNEALTQDLRHVLYVQ